MQMSTLLPQSRQASKLKSHASPGSAAAVTVMVATAENVVTATGATSQARQASQLWQAIQRLLFQSQNRFQHSKSLHWLLLNL